MANQKIVPIKKRGAAHVNANPKAEHELVYEALFSVSIDSTYTRMDVESISSEIYILAWRLLNRTCNNPGSEKRFHKSHMNIQLFFEMRVIKFESDKMRAVMI